MNIIQAQQLTSTLAVYNRNTLHKIQAIHVYLVGFCFLALHALYFICNS